MALSSMGERFAFRVTSGMGKAFDREKQVWKEMSCCPNVP